MKKQTGLALLLSCLSLSLLLAGCGQAKQTEFDPDTLPVALLESGAFSQPIEYLGADLAPLLYGVEAEHITSCAIYGSVGVSAEELAVLVLDSESAANAAMEGLRTRVSDQTFAMEDYLPDEVPKLESAILLQRGNSVLLVVANDAAAAQAVIDALD